MAFSREMHHRADFMLAHQLGNQFGVGNVTMNKVVQWVAFQRV